MKTKRYLVQGFLLLLCSLTAMAGSPSEGTQHPQEPQKQNGKRPRIQTSASEKEIVFKPVTGQGQTVVNDSPKKKEAKKESRQPKTKVSRQRKVSERYMALKTNIAYDAIAVPNLAFEIQCIQLQTFGNNLRFIPAVQRSAKRNKSVGPDADRLIHRIIKTYRTVGISITCRIISMSSNPNFAFFFREQGLSQCRSG